MSRIAGREPGSSRVLNVSWTALLLGLSMPLLPPVAAEPAAEFPAGETSASRPTSTAAPFSPAVRFVSRSRFLMGAPLAIEVAGEDAEQAIEAAFKEVARLDQVLSNWHESELVRLNDRAATGPVRCSEDLFRAVTSALHWAEETEGAFDPTVEPVIRRLGLRGEEGRLPEPGTEALRPAVDRGDPDPDADAAGRRAPVDWRNVRLDPAARTVAFLAPGMGLDLGGIGKGIALDAALRVLRACGITSALLDFGGQMLALGSGPGSDGWIVGLADPAERDRSIGALTLRDASLATSGQEERSRPGADGPVGHIIDPRTQAPAPFLGTVSIMSPDATSADALSTALFVMGPERGPLWAKARGRDVLFQFHDQGGRLIRRGTGLFRRAIVADEASTIVTMEQD